jgi:hypothetical protein
MKKIKSLLFVALVCFLFLNCSGTKTIKFANQKDEIYPSGNLKTFLKDNKSPKVVLRTPSAKADITATETKNEIENSNYLYDAIEKELLKLGFTVRDRQLFNQVVSNNDNNTDYSKLTSKTDTELIIELSKLDSKVLYETNKFYTDKGSTGVLSYNYKRYGATVEFKIILMKNNEFAGTYTFNYTPCSNDNPCIIDENFTKKWKSLQKGKTPTYEVVEKNEMEEFIRDATRQLVESMRN